MPKSPTTDTGEKTKNAKAKSPARAAARKPASAKSQVRAATVTTPVNPASPTPPSPSMANQGRTLSPEEHYRMLQSEAYRIAERDGFKEGKELDYWLMAERSVGEKQETQG